MELLTLVIVDDEPIILKGLTETYDWENMGFQVIGSARDGEAALELIREKEPDVVMTDVRMKRMDGLTLIEKSKEAGLKTMFVVISAYRDFDYAKKACQIGALSYLLKPIEDEELKETMQDVYEKCTQEKFKERNYNLWEKILVEDRDNFLNQMLGRYLDEGISEEEMLDFFMSLDRKKESAHYFAVVIAGIDLARQVVNQKEFDMKQYLLESGLLKKLSEHYQVWTRKMTDMNGTCYIVDLKTENSAEKLKGILTALRLEMKTDLICAMSVPAKGLTGMKSAYRQAIGLYEMASEAGAGFLEAGEHHEFAKKSQYSLDVETQILASMRKNARPQLKKAYEKFIYTLPNEENTARVYLRRLAVRVEFTMEEAYGMTNEMQTSFSNFYHILEQVVITKLVDVLYQLLLSLMDQRLEQDFNPSDEYFKDYIPTAIEYIKEHLHEETLSITEVSESVYLNPVYFGRMFKKIMNMPFKRYVQQIRLERAKEMLLEEKESIAGICLKVGIPNQSYFTQLFKQNTGTLPSEYKRSLE